MTEVEDEGGSSELQGIGCRVTVKDVWSELQVRVARVAGEMVAGILKRG